MEEETLPFSVQLTLVVCRQHLAEVEEGDFVLRALCGSLVSISELMLVKEGVSTAED